MNNAPLLLKILISPSIVIDFTPHDWNTFLSQVRSANLAYYCFQLFEREQLLVHLPDKILEHLKNEVYFLQHLHRQVKQEVNVINSALASVEITPIYLKGAAYLLTDLPISQSRLFSDIDILLTKEEIFKAEKLLKCFGWISQKTDDYDQLYYRKYMHEIPPMQHISRGSVLDLHHNILPICGSNPIDINILKNNLQTIQTPISCNVLSNEAIYLHCAVHLFHEGEFDKGLRDLTDLNGLYRYFISQDDDFFQKLMVLAKQTKLEKSLYFALHYSHLILKMPLSINEQQFLKDFHKTLSFPSLNDFIFTNVLIPYHKTAYNWKTKPAKFLGYWRGHMARMPLKLLIPHLIKKSFMGFADNFIKEDKNKTRPRF